MASIKKATGFKAKDTCKNQSENKKSKIYSPRDENITALRKKEKLEIKKTTKMSPFEINRISTVLN